MRVRKTKTTTQTPVDAITHSDKRANLPTADAQDFVAPEMERPVPVRYPRDPSLDPQLVWKGKDALDSEDLVAEAPPIYIQEKIDPRVLIENLRRTAARPEDEPELTLFDAFDGLSELDLVDFYRHQANWSNRMILGDSLNVMASLAEREGLRGKVQMIYLDPPYGIKFGSNWQASARQRNVRDGRFEDTSREVEQIKAFRDTWELGIHSYLTYLRDRFAAARDLLTDSGSIFVQIGDENVHLVRSLLDEVFGSENFAGQIAFAKTSSQSTTKIQSVFDTLLVYAKAIDSLKFRQLAVPKKPGERGAKQYTLLFSPDLSEWRHMTAGELRGIDELPVGWRVGGLGPVVSQDAQVGPRSEPYHWDGQPFPVPANRHWTYDPLPGGGMDRLRALGRLRRSGRNLRTVLLTEDNPTTPLDNVWLDTGTGSFTEEQVFVVQTAVKVVQRCLLMTTDPGDLVLDPTCGSGTTAYVAEQWGRRWITIDTSRVALALARQRLMGARFPYYLLADSAEGRAKESQLSATPLPPTQVTNDVRHGFVYERAPHITLGSIANNPDIKAGMSREQIDSAIRRHAEFELLYDKPYENARLVRVSGPFTVESLSPHRSLAFAGSTADGSGAANTTSSEDVSHGDAAFEQTILANLRAAGIQNGRKGERLTFDTVEPYAAAYIQTIGEREDPPDGTPKRVGITIGPQYGVVGPRFIKDAAREANRSGDLDLLCVLAFAFDPAVLGTGDDYIASDEGFANVAAERRLGRVPVLLVRMNADLVMGEELKKTGAGNLFTVFGEPDIEIKRSGDELSVLLRGVDVYDPNTGETRNNETDQIALWMIDTEYNGESFFVRHCYFTGGQDPYARLKAALKADIDEEAWASLYRTESRPFPRPESGKIAVKVINDYGDEVMKVFDV
jgi:adenine-specific DNA-methyltransferase